MNLLTFVSFPYVFLKSLLQFPTTEFSAILDISVVRLSSWQWIIETYIYPGQALFLSLWLSIFFSSWLILDAVQSFLPEDFSPKGQFQGSTSGGFLISVFIFFLEKQFFRILQTFWKIECFLEAGRERNNRRSFIGLVSRVGNPGKEKGQQLLTVRSTNSSSLYNGAEYGEIKV